MIERFEGEAGRRLRVEAFAGQKMVAGYRDIAEELADRCTLEELAESQQLIEQDSDSNDVYFIISGQVGIVVNGRQVAIRSGGDHVGEMAAIQPTQRRAASVVVLAPTVVARISEPDFAEIAGRHPQLYRHIAQELSRRLLERNKLVQTSHDKIRVFIISSAESLAIARAVQAAFEHDDFLCTIWTDGTFRVTSYTIEALEAQIDNSDFAIAIAHSDDMTATRGQDWPTPRDNVIFELGLFMGRLGRSRAILMEPRDEKVKLPSDLAGITAISYRFNAGADVAANLGPACTRLREHILSLGPNNG